MSGEDNIWHKIIKVAQDDGRITEDESKLIKKIMENAQEYEEVLTLAIEDGTIDPSEKSDLINRRATILDNAYREASDDFEISDDEYAIIAETLRILHQLESNENKYVSPD